MVVSSHHQAVKNIGKGLDIVATSMDGKSLMLIHKKYRNVIGVQFHPGFILFAQ
ncbi:MAG: gamma-glutamyl-gamma-aminobutyrate hydrolase family protein [Saprospiraceae bacterium]